MISMSTFGKQRSDLTVAFNILCPIFSQKPWNYSWVAFRKVDCFRLGWPMRADADFFKTPKFAYPNRLNGVSLLIIFTILTFSFLSDTLKVACDIILQFECALFCMN